MRFPRGSRSLLARSAIRLLLCVAISGCGTHDPVEELEQRQAAGDYAGTLAPLRDLLVTRSHDPEVNYLYGRALSHTGQVGLAQWSLRKAMEDPEWLLPAGRQLTFDALGARDYATAIEATARVLEAHPDDVHVMLMSANANAHSRRDPELALAQVDRILQLDPGYADALQPRIVALIALERVDEAADAIEELGRRIEETGAEERVQAWHCATTALFAQESGDEPLARTRWEACLERFPSHANVVAGALAFYDQRGEADRPLAILRAAVAIDRDSRDYRTMLADRLRRAGAEEEAEELLRAATVSEHASLASLAWLDLARHYQATGDLGAAAAAAARAVDRASETGEPSPQMLLEYADSLVLAGELDGALAVVDEMSLPAHRAVIRARVAQETGRPEEALAHFDEAFRLWPDNPWTRYYAALAAEAIGDFDRAIEAYRYSIRIAAGATDARTRLARLHLAEGKPEEALPILRLQAEQVPLDLEAKLLTIQLEARLGRKAALEGHLDDFRRGDPEHLGRAVASAAQGTRERAGPAAALGVLLRLVSQGLELREPRHADALWALVRFAAEAGRPEAANAEVEAAVRTYPDAPDFRAVRGFWLERRGAPRDEVREAYSRALALDDENALALLGLGHLALADDPERALLLFDRAAAADPEAAEPKREATAALSALARFAAAERRLASLLDEHPYDAAAATRLAELQLARGSASERTLELARRAVRFGGGADAYHLLSRVYQQRNEPQAASEAAARAQQLQQRDGGGS